MSGAGYTFKPGQLVAGRYLILRALDAGGMGEVFVAHDEQLDRQVALKAMGRAIVSDPEFRERFRREATAAARAQHASVVQVFERGEHEGVPFMVTELLDGHSLSQRIAAAGRLQPGFAARIGGDIADAMHAVHAVGIIHRDLKPANVFVADMGQPRESVKVLDFGVAKLLDAQKLTGSAEFVGTPAYTAPEQLLDTRRASPRSDVWSIGCIVYEMLTGRRPFVGNSHQELVARILNDDPVAPSRLARSTPPALDSVLARALQKSPEDRFNTAAELSRALYAIAADEGEAVPVALSPPPGRPTAQAAASEARQHDTELALAATLLSQPSDAWRDRGTLEPRPSRAVPAVAVGTPDIADAPSLVHRANTKAWVGALRAVALLALLSLLAWAAM